MPAAVVSTGRAGIILTACADETRPCPKFPASAFYPLTRPLLPLWATSLQITCDLEAGSVEGPVQ